MKDEWIRLKDGDTILITDQYMTYLADGKFKQWKSMDDQVWGVGSIYAGGTLVPMRRLIESEAK